MKRPLACVLLVAALFAVPVMADGPKRTIVVRGQQMPAAIVLILDKSGSMSVDDKYARACFEAKCIAEDAGDGAKVRFVAFANDVEFYKGWIALPDAEALAIADAWCRTRAVERRAMTNVAGALAAVLEKDVDESIGVVIITDGGATDFGDQPGDVERAANAIVALNQRRKHPATIGVLSVDADADTERFGLIVAKGAGGSYVRTGHATAPSKK